MEKASNDEASLQIAVANRSACFEQVQEIWDISMDISDADNREEFMCRMYSLEKIKEDFRRYNETCDRLFLKLNPKAKTDGKSLKSFLDICYKLEFKHSREVSSVEVRNKTSPKGGCRLPPLELVTFDGSMDEWNTFFVSFKCNVHDNPDLTEDEKLYYLLGKLNGKARSAILGIEPCGKNYGIIINALKDRFEDSRGLAHQYIDRMLDFKPSGRQSFKDYENFLDRFVSAYSALKNLKIESLLDFVILHIAMKKVNVETVHAFELQNTEKIPQFDKFVSFVKHNMKIEQNFKIKRESTSSRETSICRVFLNEDDSRCPSCKSKEHFVLQKCSNFINLTPKNRFNEVKKLNLCLNCLKPSHTSNQCSSEHRCNVCKSLHHSLLHFEKPLNREAENNVAGVSLCSTEIISNKQTVLLGTAIVKCLNKDGRWVSVRTLVDCASQSDFITPSCCKKLNLEIYGDTRNNFVSGIGSSKHPVLGITKLVIHSRHNEKFKLDLNPLVVDHISSLLPTSVIDRNKLRYVDGLPLADNTYYLPRDVEMIIGARSFPLILKAEVVSSGVGLPHAIETELGYLIMGAAPIQSAGFIPSNCSTSENNVSSFCTVSSPEIDMLLTRFWELERVPEHSMLSPEDEQCESNYVQTTSRDEEGRYIVSLPFKEDPCLLGNSFEGARRRYLAQERRMGRETKDAYNNIVKEYLERGYISRVKDNRSGGYYIPHHAVHREDKSSTKLRIVLDASCKTSNGKSLNDILYTGKNLQMEIFNVLLNLRLFPIVVNADIRQMYLQIKVKEEHKCYQRLLYRFDSDESLQTYQFERVTFGMRCSPFLAIRTIRQLGMDEGEKFPLAAEILKRDIYMDDVVSSVESVSEALDLSCQLIKLFKAGGFELVKFTSNNASVLEGLPESSRLAKEIRFDISDIVKVLGMHWLPQEDLFSFRVDVINYKHTKRSILATIARLWDVLGFVSPCILYAKLILRGLWIQRLDWDSPLPLDMLELWTDFVEQLKLLENVKIPRHVGVFRKNCSFSLIGFADASEKAYGAVIYTHVQYENGSNCVKFLCAKSRVAPIKTVSIPRLELCAALLLAQLFNSVQTIYSSRLSELNIIGYSDSIVVLNWIHSSPHRWQTFVSNRVARIHELVDFKIFRHVDGKHNPADCISRGLTPSQLLNHDMWFEGPSWLNTPVSELPFKPFKESSLEIPEEKTFSFATVSTKIPTPLFIELASGMSSWSKLLRCIVYVCRFAGILNRQTFVTSSDLDFAERRILVELQGMHFSEELNKLRKGLNCSRAIQRLKPILDGELLRVGGRLSESELSYQQQHPILLPAKGHIVDLIVDYYHKVNCHAGPDLLLSILRQKYWILSARNIIRNRIFKCKWCFRLRPKAVMPEMADLKKCQVVQTVKPFIHTGTDFAGPFNVVMSRRRGAKSLKAYICLFVCLTTKAMHIEVASNLSTDCFLAAFKRFLARRGPVSHVYSDCGRNYVGAKRYLSELDQVLFSSTYGSQFADLLAENRIEWHLNTPTAAHQGGAWESNVKSLKNHLFRVVGQQILSYEEMSTVIAQIEAVLNSRPLCRMISSDPSEPIALTPAHFLTITPLKYLPASDSISGHSLNRRFSLLNELVGSFWKRWRSEYLHNLQVRQKWCTSSNPIKIGQVVILSTDNVPVLHWPLGVIEDVMPGRDGVVRTVKVRTTSGSYLRPAVRLCPLPNQ